MVLARFMTDHLSYDKIRENADPSQKITNQDADSYPKPGSSIKASTAWWRPRP